MDFYDVLAEVIKLLQREGRASYRALKRQFNIDDDYLDDLKDAILYAHPVTDDGRGLVWAGDTITSEPNGQHGVETVLRFQLSLRAVIGLLKNEGRVTYRTLQHILDLDDKMLAEIREELAFRRLALDEGGKGLVWTGETPASMQPGEIALSPHNTGASAPISPASPAPQPHVAATDATTNGPPASLEDAPAKQLPEEQIDAPQPVRSAPEAERRQLTVMFCDLADSTQLSQRLDPEDLREVVRAYQETAAEIIQQYGGHMAQYLGDGLLVYFGWPVAHEDDAQRALHAGLGIVLAITTTLNPRLKTEKSIQLSVRLGIHTGPVVVGQMGGGGRSESLATGETVNIAARLEGLAQPNTVVISSATERLARGAFALKDLGAQVLKGIAEPMGTFRVLGPMEVYEDETTAAGVPFLVGRDEEVGLLLRRWEQSKEGLGQAVLISGEAGIGKSSLVTTIRHHVVQEGYTRITFRCSPYHTNSALYPLIMHMEHMLGFERDESPDAKLDKLEQVLRTTSFPVEESVPLLATLLAVPIEHHYPALTLSPQQQRQQTLDTLVGWLIEESGKQPVLAVWEDLHWADPSTLELLSLVIEQAPTVPMLHLLTFRPEFTPPWPMRSHMTPITLNRLERGQVEALITHLARGKALPSAVVAHLVAKTDGVPLYVEELTKMLLDSALLREEAEQYRLTGPLSSVAIPDTLQDSLMARLDRTGRAKEVAQLGSVLGREFTYEMLQAIAAQDDETLEASLAQLVEAELLYQRGRPPRATYIFKHALIQDEAYVSLLRSIRQQVHQRIAQVLEERFPDVVETQPELLAQHYTEAGLTEPAIDYWQQAGERDNERSAHQEAISHLTTGLHVLQMLPESPARDQQELLLQIALGAASLIIKGHGAPEVEAAYTRAGVLCQQLGDSQEVFPALFGLWRFHVVQPDYPLALQLGESLLSLAERSDETPLHVMAHYALGCTYYFLGDLLSARRHLDKVIALYTPAQRRSPLYRAGQDPGVACHTYAAWTLWALGYPDQSLACIRDALVLATELAHPFSIAFAHLGAAGVCQFRREGQDAHDHAETAIALSTEHGFPLWLGGSTILRGWALTTGEQQTEGMSQMRQGVTTWRATGTELWVPYFLTLMAEGYGNLGQVQAALSTLNEVVEIMQHTGEHCWQAEVFRVKGTLLLSASVDNQEEAEACFQKACDIARQQQARSLELRAAISLACLWQSQNKHQEAYDLLAPVYGWFTEGFDTADLIDATELLDELAEVAS